MIVYKTLIEFLVMIVYKTLVYKTQYYSSWLLLTRIILHCQVRGLGANRLP